VTIAIAIFSVAMIAIASDRVDRTKAALAGATLILFTQTIDQEQAVEAIDFNTIGLLAGMMLLVKVTEATGLYNYLAIRAGQISKGRSCRHSSTT
jgi:Na+/H+ antiporter NhaD/arsenite permease-like protein